MNERLSSESSRIYIKEIKFDSPDFIKFLNITHIVNDIIGLSGIKNGYALINSLHTTLGLKVTETEEPKLLEDFKEFLLRIVSQDWRSIQATEEYKKLYPTTEYNHRCQDNPLSNGNDIGYNAASHIRALFFNPSINWPVENGRLRLGTFQGVLAAELDGRDENNENGVRKRTIQVRIDPVGPVINLDQ